MKVAVFSIHKSYDYRIYRHIKMLLRLGMEVDYFNITNEKVPKMDIVHTNFKYIPFHIRRKISLDTLRTFWHLLKIIRKNNYDYYFIQDELLIILFLFIGKRQRNKVVLDVHESLKKESFGKIMIRALSFLTKKKLPCFTALESNVAFLRKHFSKVFVLYNIPLLEDFSDVYNNNRLKQWNVIYFGMITEENRQMLKTLEVMKILLQTGNFTATLIGSIANRQKREEIEKAIEELKSQFGERFQYLGPLSRKDIIGYLLKGDFLLLLLDMNHPVASNKLYEALLAGEIVVTNHDKFYPKIPEDLLIKVNKDSSPQEIAMLMFKLINNPNEIIKRKKEGRNWIISSKLFWETYENIYKEIFK